MMGEIKVWQKRIFDQTEAKKTMAQENTPFFISQLILGEAQELVEAINNDEEAFGVGSELADILYLTLYLCEQLGFEAGDLLEMKSVRNDMKHASTFYSNGIDYVEAKNRSELIWRALGGDIAYSHAYLDMIDKISS